MLKLYVYEHCPYCIRPRFLAGVKNLDLALTFLLNDDEEAHYKLVGKKIVPILQKENNTFMVESLDICNYLDSFDNNKIIKPSKNNHALTNQIDKMDKIAKFLTYPRFILHPQNKKDFNRNSAIAYFQNKKEKGLGITFKEALVNSHQYAKKLLPILAEINKLLIHEYATDTEFNIDDIIIFPSLRSLTIAKDAIDIPDNIQTYLERMANLGKIELYKEFSYL